MGYFRAVVCKQEMSERALSLTEELLNLNPASYTFWQYRRQLLLALKSDLNKEMDFLDIFALENPKNYQIWQHRRHIAELVGDGKRELLFTQQVFVEDSKNYHAWAHRQWVLKRFNLWGTELSYVEQCLDLDIRNNSAWNQVSSLFCIT